MPPIKLVGYFDFRFQWFETKVYLLLWFFDSFQKQFHRIPFAKGNFLIQFEIPKQIAKTIGAKMINFRDGLKSTFLINKETEIKTKG